MREAAKRSEGIALRDRPRVVGLIRVSTAEQAADDRGGIPRQRQVIEDTIKRKNLDCLRVYELSGVSGTQVLDDPQIQEILRMISSKVISGIVLADLDRLFRPSEPIHYAILQGFKDTGAIIYSEGMEYDMQDRNSALQANIRSAFASFELSLMKERQQGACEAKRRAGMLPTNDYTLPLGVSYDRKTEKFYYNDDIGKVVELFRLYDEGGIHNYSELGRRLGLNNVTVKVMLRNQLYIGLRVISEKRGDRVVSKSGISYRKKIKREPDSVISNRVIDIPAISEECFRRVQTCMEVIRFNHHSARAKDRVHNLGAGVLVCGYCGEPIFYSSGKSSKSRRNSYVYCKSNYYQHRESSGGCKQPNLRADDADSLIEEFTLRTLANPDTLTSLVLGSFRRSTAVISPFPVQTSDSRIAALKKRDARLLDAYESGTIEHDEFRSRRIQIRKEIAEAAEKVERPAPANSLSVEEFCRRLVRAAIRLKRIKDRSEKKAIIRELFRAIHLKDRSIVAFRFEADVPIEPNQSAPSASALIHLDVPFRLPSNEDDVPPEHLRCGACRKVLPKEDFYPTRKHCKPCVNRNNRERYKRKKFAALNAP